MKKNPHQFERIVNMQLGPALLKNYSFKSHKAKMSLVHGQSYSPDERFTPINTIQNKIRKGRNIKKQRGTEKISKKEILEKALRKHQIINLSHLTKVKDEIYRRRTALHSSEFSPKLCSDLSSMIENQPKKFSKF